MVLFHRIGNPQPPFARYLEQRGVEHIVVRDTGRFDWRLVQRVGAVLRHRVPSLVQTHGYKATAMAWELRRRGAAWPWVGFFHGDTRVDFKDRLFHRIEHKLLASADRVVVMSQRQRKQFGKLLSRVRVLHNAIVPLAAGGSAEERRHVSDLLKAQTRPLIGVVGRLSREKGVDVFLDACSRLAASGFAFSAVVIGDGELRKQLEVRAERFGLEKRISFPGRIEAMDLVYSHLDLLVIPSRSEGLPNVLLEALNADVPVVATDVGAIPEVLASSRWRALVPPDDAPALAGEMEVALRAHPVGSAHRPAASVREAFSLQARVQAHLSLYGELIAG